nr:hypothetical protein [Clostridioides sp.]
MNEQEIREAEIVLSNIRHQLRIMAKEGQSLPTYYLRLKELTKDATEEELEFLESWNDELGELFDKIRGTLLGGK